MFTYFSVSMNYMFTCFTSKMLAMISYGVNLGTFERAGRKWTQFIISRLIRNSQNYLGPRLGPKRNLEKYLNRIWASFVISHITLGDLKCN